MEHVLASGLEAFEEQWHFTHTVRVSGLLLLSGITGVGVDGVVPGEPAEQFDRAFTHLRLSLEAAGATMDHVAEMTTYHVGLRRHLEAFVEVKDRYVVRPYPAWSAIGVAELITEGALVEIRAIAVDPGRRGG